MESCYRPISWPMFRRSDGNTSISPENIAGQSLSVGFRPLPQTTPAAPGAILRSVSLNKKNRLLAVSIQ
ncbi:hypothetical protein CYF55_22685 [Salmonella enterica subsp. enterica serovar Newport]|uniref:Uncharacterized protein n=1 Tax=Salmonella newport TaxID=108619 RepID=A0A636EVS1_SALNE|nr:hypothetical protein [Salmonella enterica subsp. enterica serovar Newport]EDK3913420.1 hypothetical protein [Salmonella enterica subsp. enterica serovar Enteritidis]EDK8015771.1 hypothetical protein [Salmonella enterica subsp. enterica serovar Muenchen]EDN3452595.1 hypothetical protein [Salmonella enterica]EDI0089486.1 hypothetical protein [Salmonella enterica subsp. enterica serovar Newport]